MGGGADGKFAAKTPGADIRNKPPLAGKSGEEIPGKLVKIIESEHNSGASGEIGEDGKFMLHRVARSQRSSANPHRSDIIENF